MNLPSLPSFARTTFLSAALLLAASATAATSYWDTSATAGLQSGDGTWGVDNFWSATTAGISPGAWTSGNIAEFRAQTTLLNTVTVGANQGVAGLTFTAPTTGTADWHFAGSGSLALTANATINTGNGRVTVANTISGAKSLTMVGVPAASSVLLLSGANTYTGGTIVQAGRLQVDGSILGLMTVSSGAYLSGAGSVGDVVLSANAYLNADKPNQAGSLSMDSLTLKGGSTIYWDLEDATQSAGYDRFNIQGALDLAGLTTSTKLKLTLAGNPLVFDATKSTRFTIFSYGTLSVGSNSSLVDVLTFDTSGLKDGVGASVAADRFTLSDNAAAKTLELVYTAPVIPEPSTYGLGLGALGLAIAFLRRRRAQRAV